jgi:hypothetical protein
MVLLTGGMIIEHSKLAIIPLIIALISGMFLISKNATEKGENILKNDKGEGEVFGAIIVFILFILFVGVIVTLLGVYRIDTGQGAILTDSNGNKVPIIDVGWHTRMPLLTDVSKYSIVNNNIYFPADYLNLETTFTGDKQTGSIGIDIKTTDDKVIDTGAVMSFEIVDLIQFGVKNTNPQEQLQKAYDAIIFNYLQSQASEKITTEITTVNEELLQKLKGSKIEEQFGIKINSVSLLRPTFTKIALDALAEKQAIQAKSEGELNAAKNRAAAIETIAQAQKNQADILKNVPQEQLDFNAKLALYDTLKGQPNVIWVIPSGQPVVLTK